MSESSSSSTSISTEPSAELESVSAVTTGGSVSGPELPSTSSSGAASSSLLPPSSSPPQPADARRHQAVAATPTQVRRMSPSMPQPAGYQRVRAQPPESRRQSPWYSIDVLR